MKGSFVQSVYMNQSLMYFWAFESLNFEIYILLYDVHQMEILDTNNLFASQPLRSKTNGLVIIPVPLHNGVRILSQLRKTLDTNIQRSYFTMMSDSKERIVFWDWNIVKNNHVQCLIWWLNCRGCSASSSRSKKCLITRFLALEMG